MDPKWKEAVSEPMGYVEVNPWRSYGQSVCGTDDDWHKMCITRDSNFRFRSYVDDVKVPIVKDMCVINAKPGGGVSCINNDRTEYRGVDFEHTWVIEDEYDDDPRDLDGRIFFNWSTGAVDSSAVWLDETTWTASVDSDSHRELFLAKTEDAWVEKCADWLRAKIQNDIFDYIVEPPDVHRCTLEGIKDALMRLAGVESVGIEEVGPGAICVEVSGGDAYEIGQCIWDNKPVGVSTKGKTFVDVNIGLDYVPVFFNRKYLDHEQEPNKHLPDEDPHAGQEYNEYTGRWSWL